MSEEYYGPTCDAAKCASQLLELPATGAEQDWEIEFSSPDIIGKIINALKASRHDLEVRSALSMLLFRSIEDAVCTGVFDEEKTNDIAYMFSQDDTLRKRMQFFWIELGRSENLNLMRSLLNCEPRL